MLLSVWHCASVGEFDLMIMMSGLRRRSEIDYQDMLVCIIGGFQVLNVSFSINFSFLFQTESSSHSHFFPSRTKSSNFSLACFILSQTCRFLHFNAGSAISQRFPEKRAWNTVFSVCTRCSLQTKAQTKFVVCP